MIPFFLFLLSSGSDERSSDYALMTLSPVTM
jgi:hypothetical protein